MSLWREDTLALDIFCQEWYGYFANIPNATIRNSRDFVRFQRASGWCEEADEKSRTALGAAARTFF